MATAMFNSSIPFKRFALKTFDMYLICSLLFMNTNAQDGATYLQSAIKDLSKLNPHHTQRRTDHFRAAKSPSPYFSPTREELAHLYEAALKRGESVKIHDEDGGPSLDAAVYEIEDDDRHDPKDAEDDTSAYYLYYYPLKAFIDELSSGENPSPPTTTTPQPHYMFEHDVEPSDTFMHHEVVTMKPTPAHQVHTHTHQHNVHIMETKNSAPPEPVKPSKNLEPLFMAISGFIGMTVMFVLSALILPKIGEMKPRDVRESAEVTSMLKIIFQAIEGYDCSERFACEFGKTARAFNMHNNRFVKLIRRIGPVSLSKQLYDINKYSNKKYKCAVIQCKMKSKKQTQKPKKPTSKRT